VPDQDARFGLLQPPVLGLLAAMVVPTQRTVAAQADAGPELRKQLRASIADDGLGTDSVPAFLTAARPRP
jgi:hypothetical protein